MFYSNELIASGRVVVRIVTSAQESRNESKIYSNYTCDKQVLWESAGAFFPRDNSLVSDRKSHNSDSFGLAVRCLLFNPEGPGSNPCLCANFFYKIFEAEDSHFFRQYETPPPPFRLFETFFRKFFNVPKGSSLHFFDILQQNER